MTCIVALAHGGTVYMGADSASSDGWSMIERNDPKIFRVGPFLIGFTTSFRMGQLLGYSLTVPERRADVEPFAYMCTTFIEAVRSCLKSGGYASKQNEREEAGVFLCGYEGRIFRIDSDYHVGESLLNFSACGCGQDLALGSLYSTVGLDAEQRVTTALCAAARFSAGVREPFKIETL
ncbi:hypothetical protein [Paraburkholderia sacchari]|uniref:hypothetical protein n=1 Tax=Paraburkholderia sacchari TaxID=159450 RepID=UPI001BCB7D2F|nr:hypothetical protein [Paraburkholderia sacchari]